MFDMGIYRDHIQQGHYTSPCLIHAANWTRGAENKRKTIGQVISNLLSKEFYEPGYPSAEKSVLSMAAVHVTGKLSFLVHANLLLITMS